MNLNSITGKIITIVFLTATIFGCGSGGGNGQPPAVTTPVALSCGGGNGGGGFTETAPGSGVQTATVVLTGDQETPPVCTGARATGTITVVVATGAISGSVTVEDITPTAAHIHQAVAGVVGSVVVPLEQDLGNPNLLNIPAGAILDATQLLAGDFYFNVHTTDNPGGEIRGQIGREVFTSALTARQEVPAPTSATASGSGQLVLDPNTNAAEATFTVTGLTGDATAAHIHQQAVGTAGGVIIPMSETSSGSGSFTVSQVLDGGQLTALRDGLLYFNVHTVANGPGESRGQIGRAVRFAELDQAQEAPPTGQSATGTGFGVLDPATRTLSGSMTGSGLTGATNGAHIHNEARGVNGGVIVGLTVTQDGAGGGTFAASGIGAINGAQVKAFLDGDTYLNIHTDLYTGGEIRGQLDLD